MPYNSLILNHQALAKRLAWEFYRKGPKHGLVGLDDLESCAFAALCEAAARFDTQAGYCFSTFVYRRIRGAMIDFVRHATHYDDVGKRRKIIRFDEFDGKHSCNRNDESCPDIETFVARKRLRELIALLPEREREVIRQYYFEDRTMREIADNFSLKSTASISRNHTRALERLAAAIGGE